MTKGKYKGFYKYNNQRIQQNLGYEKILFNLELMEVDGYGMDNKEKDDEIFNQTGASINYGMRTFDARLPIFWSVDPLTKKYPMLTPYQFASNTPIQATDLDGGEANYRITYIDPNSKTGTTTKEMTWKQVHPQSTVDHGELGEGTIDLYLHSNGERADNLTTYNPTLYEQASDFFDIGGLWQSGTGYDPKESTATMSKKAWGSFDTKGLLDLFDILGIKPDKFSKPSSADPSKPDLNSLGGQAADVIDAFQKKDDKKDVQPAGKNYVEDKGKGILIYTKDKKQKDTVKIINTTQMDANGNNLNVPIKGFPKDSKKD